MEINPTSDQLAPVSTITPQHSPVTTPDGTGVKFAQAMGGAVTVAGQMAAKVSGGGALGAGPLAGSVLGGGSGGLGGLTGASSGDLSYAQLLQQQEQIQQQSAEFTSLTNISKTEHDTRMSVIRNLAAQ